MNRKLKFRIWDKQDNRFLWHFTSFIKGLIWQCHTDEPPEKRTGKIYFRDDNDFIVMQYTGLKDKHGVEIYEGDILKCYDHPTNVESGVYPVVFNNGCFEAHLTLSFWGSAWVEIIGNIYENPELIK